MKSQKPDRQNHGDAIDGLVRAEPTGGVEKKLQRVRNDCDAEREQHPRAGDFWPADLGRHFQLRKSPRKLFEFQLSNLKN